MLELWEVLVTERTRPVVSACFSARACLASLSEKHDGAAEEHDAEVRLSLSQGPGRWLQVSRVVPSLVFVMLKHYLQFVK